MDGELTTKERTKDQNNDQNASCGKVPGQAEAQVGKHKQGRGEKFHQGILQGDFHLALPASSLEDDVT
jgi:hypothetical protein